MALASAHGITPFHRGAARVENELQLYLNMFVPAWLGTFQ